MYFYYCKKVYKKEIYKLSEKKTLSPDRFLNIWIMHVENNRKK